MIINIVLNFVGSFVGFLRVFLEFMVLVLYLFLYVFRCLKLLLVFSFFLVLGFVLGVRDIKRL